MGTNCAPVLFCNEREHMLSLSNNNQAGVIEAFNSTSRYLDGLLNIDNPYFKQMAEQIYSTDLKLNKTHLLESEAPFQTWTCPQLMT